LELPRTAILQRKNKVISGTVLEAVYEYGWAEHASANDTQAYDPIRTNAYYDASIPCSWNGSISFYSERA
jgi:hypothetical protein